MADSFDLGQMVSYLQGGSQPDQNGPAKIAALQSLQAPTQAPEINQGLMNRGLQSDSGGLLHNLLPQLLGHAASKYISNSMDASQLDEKQLKAQQSLDASTQRALEYQHDASLSKQDRAIKLLGLGGDFGDVGKQSYKDANTPKQIKPFIAGGSNPLMRQSYTLDENGQPVKVNVPEYAAFQERQAPITYSQPFLTTAESHPGLTPNSVVQNSSRGELKVIHVAPHQHTTEIDPDTGVIKSTDLATNETHFVNPTEAQGKAASMANRAALLSNQFSSLMSKGFDPTAQSKESWKDKALQSLASSEHPAMSSIGTSFMEPHDREYRNIKNAWNEAFLRDESGASINRSEWASKEGTYWPTLGDSAQDVANKAALRSTAEKGLYGKMGNIKFNTQHAGNAVQQVKQVLQPITSKPVWNPNTRTWQVQ